jgi:hypothetical protein
MMLTDLQKNGNCPEHNWWETLPNLRMFADVAKRPLHLAKEEDKGKGGSEHPPVGYPGSTTGFTVHNHVHLSGSSVHNSPHKDTSAKRKFDRVTQDDPLCAPALNLVASEDVPIRKVLNLLDVTFPVARYLRFATALIDQGYVYASFVLAAPSEKIAVACKIPDALLPPLYEVARQPVAQRSAASQTGDMARPEPAAKRVKIEHNNSPMPMFEKENMPAGEVIDLTGDDD